MFPYGAQSERLNRVSSRERQPEAVRRDESPLLTRTIQAQTTSGVRAAQRCPVLRHAARILCVAFAQPQLRSK